MSSAGKPLSTGDTKPSSASRVTANNNCQSSRNNQIAETPQPPYYAVIFSSLRNAANDEGVNQDYATTADRMVELAAQEEGFLGVESVRDGLGITVSYWSDLESIKRWKGHCEHSIAQEKGQTQWYSSYKTRICLVERDYGM